MAFNLTKLSQLDARKILENANLPGTVNKDLKFAISSKADRMKTLKENKDVEDARTAAAIEIQRVWRGYYTRCKLFGILHPSVSSMHTMQETPVLPSVGHTTRMSEVNTPSPQPPTTTPEPQLSTLMTHKYKLYCERRIAAEGKSCLLMSFSDFCASIIQQWWRLQLRLRPSTVYPGPPPPTTRGEVSTVEPITRESTPYEPSPTPQGSSKGRVSTASRGSKIIDRNQAAKIVQRTWRRHIDIQVYRYYRDLISFRSRGDPSLMLRCINPRESALLDSGAGVHIKFRLAGAKFPPNIYYKIFTHRNIADIGAFAPRDYTEAQNKQMPATFIHNKGSKAEKVHLDDRSWYERWENNGWRLVSDRLVKRVDQDPVVFDSSHKMASFPHSKLQRKADIEKKRKTKKIEWMKKMYKQGMLQAKGSQDADTQAIIQTVAQGMVSAAETRGNDAVEDWEVDELLEWTSGLNYDEYLTDWKEYATSAGSEFLSTQAKFIPDDPFSFSLVS